MLRVVICWPEIVGYMVPCFRALAAREGIELFVIAGRSRGPGTDFKFSDDVVSGLNCLLLSKEERTQGRITDAVTAFKPDILGLPGWGVANFRQLAFNPQLSHARVLMVIDTPWLGSLRQRLGKYRFKNYFARILKVAVTGERTFQAARHFGFSESQISRGASYGIDYDTFSQSFAQRIADPGGWPKRFLFTGRFAQVKAIDVLMQAYTRYRSTVANPWPLSICGSGPLESLINATPGVENMGFVQPKDQGALYARHGVFILPSRYDPWPLVIVEAVAAGLPVICTEACGSAVELVRPYYNGLIVPTEDPLRLAQAMGWMHAHHADLPEMGRAGMPFARAYSAELWATRWIEMFDEMLPGRRRA